MEIFSGSKKKEELTLVFDIGSSSVGGALFYMESSGIPKIILSIREPIILEERIDVNRFLALTLKTLEFVANKIAKSGAGAPRRVFGVLSSPWYVSQTRVVKLAKDTPFVFNSKLADDLIAKEISIFEEEHFAKYTASGNPIRPIELKNIKTVLNGYETATPLSQKATELEINIFVSMSPEDILKKIEDTINKHFSLKNIKFSSFALASFTVVRDLFSDQENFLLVDIGGEMTDISMIKKNSLRESISFPIGRNSLIRGAAGALACSLSEAESCISLFKDGHAEVSLKKKIQPIVDKLRAEWLEKFQQSLAHLSHDISIPATVYLTVDEDFAEFFSQAIKTEQFSQYTLTESKFDVIFLSASLFHGLALFKDDVVADAGLVIDAIYINRFLTKK